MGMGKGGSGQLAVGGLPRTCVGLVRERVFPEDWYTPLFLKPFQKRVNLKFMLKLQVDMFKNIQRILQVSLHFMLVGGEDVGGEGRESGEGGETEGETLQDTTNTQQGVPLCTLQHPA